VLIDRIRTQVVGGFFTANHGAKRAVGSRTARDFLESFSEAAPPGEAEPLYETFCKSLSALTVAVSRGVFGARMSVELVNDGPVTIVL
jgi:D-Tyr-tRNAtyr deacylase